MRRLVTLLIVLGVAAYPGWLLVRQGQAWYHLRAAREEMQRYHNAPAKAHLARVREVWPNNEEALVLSARLARRTGALEEAEELLRTAQGNASEPSDAIVLEFALIKASAGDLADSEDYLRKRAEREPPLRSLISEGLAEGYFRVCRFLDLTRLLDRWLEVEPDNVRALALRGEMQRQQGALQKAITDFGRVVELDPDQPDARWALATSLVEIGRYDKAIEHLERLRQAGNSDPALLVRLAQAYEGTGQRQRARQLLDEALASHPDNPLALRTRGQMAKTDGDLAEAERWLKEAVRVAPRDVRSLWALAECLELQGKTAEAQEARRQHDAVKDRLERIAEIANSKMSLSPDNPELHAELGMLWLELGQPETGERWLHAAVARRPDYGPAHAALANLYEQRGDRARAADHRRRARGAAPLTPSVRSRPTKP